MTQRFFTNKKRSAFSTVEHLLAAGLFALIVAMIAGSLVYSLETARASGLADRAVLAAQESLEAVRSIRDDDFVRLTDGTHGLALSSGQWVFSGTSDTLDDFVRSVNISPINSHTKKIDATVTWQQTAQRPGSLILTTYLTNWSEISQTEGERVAFNISSATLSGDNKELRNVTIKNTGAANITVDKMVVSWQPTSHTIERIRIDDDTVWSKNGPGSPAGTQNSGTELNIQNFELDAGQEENMDIKFTGSMVGTTITITFIMSDQSQVSISITP